MLKVIIFAATHANQAAYPLVSRVSDKYIATYATTFYKVAWI